MCVSVDRARSVHTYNIHICACLVCNMKKKYGHISSKFSGNKAGFREKYFPENSPFFKEILINPNLHLAGPLPIRRLKIDVQGLDFKLIRSVPPGLLRARVQSIQLEVIASDGVPLSL